MAKDLFQLKWLEESLPEDFMRKPMFGGFAYYWGPKLVLAAFEKSGDREYNQQQFEFELWHGCLFPVERENHQQILKKYDYLRPHPILGKWLYLPTQTEDFEEKLESILKEIRGLSPIFGVIPKSKKKKLSGNLKPRTKKPQVRASIRGPKKSKKIKLRN